MMHGQKNIKFRGCLVESSWNVMAHGDAWKGKWRGTWLMEWVASTLHTTSEHGVSSITTADAHTSAASSRLNWRPRRFKWTRLFRRKTKSGFCACSITFQTQSTKYQPAPRGIPGELKPELPQRKPEISFRLRTFENRARIILVSEKELIELRKNIRIGRIWSMHGRWAFLSYFN